MTFDPEITSPTGVERRLVFRFLAYWRALAQNGRIPLLDAIRPEEIADIWPNCLVAELGVHREDPIIRYCGPGFTNPPGDMLAHSPVSALPPRCLARMAINLHEEVQSRQVAVSRGGRLTLSNGLVLMYRAILMPLSRDEGVIDYLIGAASFRTNDPR